MKKRTMDLTHGSILPLVVRFAIPLLLSQLLQNFYNSVDSIVVGHFVSTTALAAVSCCSDITHALVGFFTGLSTGAGVLFSRYFGAKDRENLHDAIHTAMAFTFLFGILMSVLGVVFTPALLHLTRCPDDVWDEAVAYLNIYMIGIFFTAAYNLGAGVLRSVGNSRDPFNYLVITGILNIILDLVFVCALRLEVIGVAVATVISQVISMVLVLGNMMRTDDVYRFRLREMRMDFAILREILALGLPAGIQTALTGISNLFMQGYVNCLGSAAMAGYGAAKKIDRFMAMFASSVGLAGTTFISQNLGAKQQKRAFAGIRVCMLLSCAVVIVTAPLLYIFSDAVMKVFTTDASAIGYGTVMLHIILPFYLLQVTNAVYPQAVRGFGKSRAVMIFSLLGMVGMRQLYLFVVTRLTDACEAVFYAFPVGWFFASLFTIVYYLIVIKKPYLRQLNAGEITD